MTEGPLEQLNDAIQRGHEPDHVDSRWMKASAAALILLMVCALLIVYGTRAFLAREVSTNGPPISVVERTHTAKGPQTTADQPQQLRELRRTEQKRLESYEWIDESAGIARIPISRAMKIVAEQGLPKTEPGGKEPHDTPSN